MTLLYHSSPAENARLIILSIWSSKLSRIQALSWIAAEKRGSSAKRTFFHYNFKIKLRIYYKHDFLRYHNMMERIMWGTESVSVKVP